MQPANGCLIAARATTPMMRAMRSMSHPEVPPVLEIRHRRLEVAAVPARSGDVRFLVDGSPRSDRRSHA